MPRRPASGSRYVALAAILLALPVSGADPSGGRLAVPESQPSWPAIVADLEALAKAKMAEQKLPGLAIAIVQGDTLVHAKGYGVKKVGGTDPVGEHLPYFRMYDPWVTRQFRVDDLMSARSGMPGYSLDQMLFFGFSRRQYADAVAFVAPTFSFRAGFGYVNTLWPWASFLVEKHLGLSDGSPG